jgi:WD40 repeat protein
MAGGGLPRFRQAHEGDVWGLLCFASCTPPHPTIIVSSSGDGLIAVWDGEGDGAPLVVKRFSGDIVNSLALLRGVGVGGDGGDGEGGARDYIASGWVHQGPRGGWKG